MATQLGSSGATTRPIKPTERPTAAPNIRSRMMCWGVAISLLERRTISYQQIEGTTLLTHQKCTMDQIATAIDIQPNNVF
jgi:hypothetical protein